MGQIQSYLVQDHPGFASETAIDGVALSIDVLIGDPDLVGKGHGPALIRQFVTMELDRAGLELCVIGPAAENASAVRAFQKAGFRFLKTYREDDTSHPEHVLLAIHRRDLR